jgi:uncharacterized protein (DUF779 family)
VFCDERVETCYTAKGGNAGQTEEQFGQDAARSLGRRLEEGERAAHAIFRPSAGVVCDRGSEVCYDRAGASLVLTRQEFGHGAAEDLGNRIDRPRSGVGHRDGTIYSPRRGVSCDRRVDSCYTGEEAHPGWTKREFGVEAVQALEHRIEVGRKSQGGIYRPEGGGVCDRLSKVCYDRQGASANLTRNEFGREAAARMAERLE